MIIQRESLGIRGLFYQIKLHGITLDPVYMKNSVEYRTLCPIFTVPVSDILGCCIRHSTILYTYLLHFLADIMSDVSGKNVGHRGKNVGHFHIHFAQTLQFGLSILDCTIGALEGGGRGRASPCYMPISRNSHVPCH